MAPDDGVGQARAEAGTLPVFGFVCRHDRPLADGAARESAWMAQAAAGGRGVAQLWSGAQGWVVPRSYRRAPHWDVACRRAGESGWPVQVRDSGGGLVPQGPGVLNLSLAWAPAAPDAPDIGAVYRALCAGLAAALARLGLRCETRGVDGAFCDGCYNLAVGGAKIAGTAQCWRRIGGARVILAHALLLVDGDAAALTERCNAFEAALGHPRRYRAQAVTTVAAAWPAAHAGAAAPDDLRDRVGQVVAEQFARVLPPRGHTDRRGYPAEEQRWS